MIHNRNVQGFILGLCNANEIDSERDSFVFVNSILSLKEIGNDYMYICLEKMKLDLQIKSCHAIQLKSKFSKVSVPQTAIYK